MFERMSPVFAGVGDGSWYWDHHGWGWGMGLHGIFWLLLIGLVVVALVLVVRGTARDRSSPRASAVAILDARYAHGEIDRGEYLERKKDLS